MNKIIAIVGMAGSGKSEVARLFRENGFAVVRFGDVTDEEIKRRGLELNEANERIVREEFRKKHGMAAYAGLNLPRLDAARQQSGVVADGLYSWEEYLLLKDYYKDDLAVTAVWASPQMRYGRLAGRVKRGLTFDEASSRDRAEIENLNKGGPIAMADFTILNDASLADLKKQVERIIGQLK